MGDLGIRVRKQDATVTFGQVRTAFALENGTQIAALVTDRFSSMKDCFADDRVQLWCDRNSSVSAKVWWYSIWAW